MIQIYDMQLSYWEIIKTFLIAVWLGTLTGLYLSTPKVNEFTLELPLAISDNEYWVSDGTNYKVHSDSSVDYVKEASEGSAICRFDRSDDLMSHYVLDCGWMTEDKSYEKAIIDLSTLLPVLNLPFRWEREPNSTSFTASKVHNTLMYVIASFLIVGAMNFIFLTYRSY